MLRNEEEILAAYQNLISSQPGHAEPHQVSALVGHYAKLLKSYSRQLRISDKNEQRLHTISEELEIERKNMAGIAEQLSKYLPKQIYESIFSGDQTFEIKTQRKLLTVFFSDIQGFTQISSILQPEVLTHYLNRYFSELSAIAAKHGGTIDKFIGDAMMIFFGDPDTRGEQEDALACVRMAVEMQARLARLNAEWESEGLQYPLITRIGINTGWCNVGNFGSTDRMAYTIIGGEVNLAARIESKCEPGGVLMSFDTYALIKDHFEVEERELLSLKGISRPVQTYTVRRMLTEKERHEQPIDLLIPGQETIRITPPNLTLPERLNLIEDLKRTVQKLEGISHD
jgi:class 3 adenylate cyclase